MGATEKRQESRNGMGPMWQGARALSTAGGRGPLRVDAIHCGWMRSTAGGRGPVPPSVVSARNRRQPGSRPVFSARFRLPVSLSASLPPPVPMLPKPAPG